MTEVRRVIAPWPGDEQLGFLQGGVEVSGTKTLYLSGQGAIRHGKVAHPGDLLGQIMTCLDNIQYLLEDAGYEWSDVVRLNWYFRVDQMDAFTAEVREALRDRLNADGCRAPGVLLGVAALALPDMLCEFEATAAR